jgi:hypothetical protein
MVDTDVQESFDKLKLYKQLNNYKIVWTDPKNISKKDLINYIIYLKIIFPNIFKNQNERFNKFIKLVSRKTKIDIIDLINYYVNNRFTNVSFKTVIKGTSHPELIKVYVKKEVHKVI